MHLHTAIHNAADPAVCGRCGRAGQTCCKVEPGREEFCFPLSEMEWDRILDFAGDRGAFVQEPNSSNFLGHLQRLFPGEEELLERLFPDRENKFHLRLATRRDGTCVFLQPDGCELPREARPYYCRLFPFWFFSGRLNMFAPPNCLAVQEGRRPKNVMAMLSVNKMELLHTHGRLRLAWGLPPQKSMRLLPESFTRYDKEKR